MIDAEVIAGLPEPDETYISQRVITPTLERPRLSVLRETEAFSAIIEVADAAYLKANGRKCPWTPQSIKLLKQVLEKFPGNSPARWRMAVTKWYAVPANRPLSPSEFIQKLNQYL